ncbi:MAG: hypothetical protein DRP11_04095 [Candidatus Aenigmatarchaeota archaeon]|nr:MAG: hypothetical protein DRP11_04095 [Candidatus Aenigmarchaeota archaeon]
MKGKRLATVLGICVVLILAVLPFIVACGAPAPKEASPPAPKEASPPAPKVFKWRMAGFLPRGTPQEPAIIGLCEHVREASGERLDITYYAVNEIVPVMEMWEAVSKGVIEMAFSYGAYWPGKTLVAAHSCGLAYTKQDVRDFHVLLDVLGLEDVIREGYAEHNIHLVKVIPCLETVMQTKFPVTKVADLKGRVIRATGMIADMLTEAGASTVFFPGPEIYGALERGVAEGVVYGPLAPQYDQGFHEVCGYLLMPPLAVEADEFIVNMDAWNSLPDDLKEILTLACVEAGRHSSALYRHASQLALKDMVENWGTVVTYMPEEERAKMAACMVKVMDRYSAEDPLFAKATKIVKDYMKLIGLLD